MLWATVSACTALHASNRMINGGWLGEAMLPLKREITCFLSVHFLRVWRGTIRGWLAQVLCSIAYFVATIGDMLTRQIINLSISLLFPSVSLCDLVWEQHSQSRRGSSTCCSTPHLFGQIGPKQNFFFKKESWKQIWESYGDMVWK